MAIAPRVVLDPGGDTFTPGDPPHGVCWSPTDPALEEDATWVRLDDPDGIRIASSYQIVRGRSSALDKVTTGTASVTFNDTEGLLDPSNPSGPWYTHLDPMKQAAVGLMNPITGDWHTLFRGFVAGPDHQLEMWGAAQGLDVVTWELVDAFDLFANVILTRGRHGYDLADQVNFPNIHYRGTPSNQQTLNGLEPDVEVHVDGRIVKLLDDAGWPGTGNTGRPGSPAALRNIFSGNVTVQGVTYSRKDSLLSALFDAADAEFPGIANIYVSKEGVVTFHGRYARFFPDRPGYGINHWYVGTDIEAALDPDVVPLAGPLRFYRSKDDIINACVALAYNDDETTTGVVFRTNPTSITKYGYRSENFEGLLTQAGHDDAGATTSRVVETNKFADYYVDNFSQTHTRVGTLRFVGRHPDSTNAAALYQLLTRVELGDVITLTTAHPGGGGFGGDWYVEQIRYTVEEASGDIKSVTLELEVSPSGFFASNPFGNWDDT